jgi:hypothetical protein
MLPNRTSPGTPGTYVYDPVTKDYIQVNRQDGGRSAPSKPPGLQQSRASHPRAVNTSLPSQSRDKADPHSKPPGFQQPRASNPRVVNMTAQPADVADVQSKPPGFQQPRALKVALSQVRADSTSMTAQARDTASPTSAPPGLRQHRAPNPHESFRAITPVSASTMAQARDMAGLERERERERERGAWKEQASILERKLSAAEAALEEVRAMRHGSILPTLESAHPGNRSHHFRSGRSGTWLSAAHARPTARQVIWSAAMPIHAHQMPSVLSHGCQVSGPRRQPSRVPRCPYPKAACTPGAWTFSSGLEHAAAPTMPSHRRCCSARHLSCLVGLAGAGPDERNGQLRQAAAARARRPGCCAQRASGGAQASPALPCPALPCPALLSVPPSQSGSQPGLPLPRLHPHHTRHTDFADGAALHCTPLQTAAAPRAYAGSAAAPCSRFVGRASAGEARAADPACAPPTRRRSGGSLTWRTA